MNRMFPLMGALALGLLAPVRAEQQDPRAFTMGTPVVVVGQVSSPPSGLFGHKKMQVAVGPGRTDYTLHFRNAQLFGLHGQRIDEDAFDDRMWVRAEGRATKSPRRIEVTRIQILTPDTGELSRTAFYRPGFEHGYISSVAGVRQTFPPGPSGSMGISAPFVVVGRVSDDTGALETTRRIQVMAAGNEWTLHVPNEATILDTKGERISVHEIDDGQWVRAHGWRTADLRMRVDRIENLGADEAFRASAAFRTGSPLGYVEPLDASGATGMVTVTGTIREYDRNSGRVVIRDASGVEHVVYTDVATFRRNGRTMGVADLRVGDMITVESRMIHFR